MATLEDVERFKAPGRLYLSACIAAEQGMSMQEWEDKVQDDPTGLRLWNHCNAKTIKAIEQMAWFKWRKHK